MIRPFTMNEVWFLISAVQWTLALSAIAFLGGALVGLFVALARTAEVRPLRLAAIGYIQLFQGTPLLMQLFLVFFGATVLGFDVNPWVAAALGLTLNASAFLGEIWRGCIEAVPKGQWEAARALGMGYVTRMRYVVLPQAVKVAVPPTVGFSVQLIKSTSLAAIIGFTELTRAGQLVNNATFKPFLVFSIVALLYFVLCWPLSLLSSHLERRLAAPTR
ncbi:amino acid ABC transporter permease [Azospirillum sp. ST 5-10]|uniref:amino acid ABC transporter permease n=1 Tax=unclassified Azospirillum TaxID=2630922 RepID=UPI003F4A4E09